MERAIEYALLKVDEAYYGQNTDLRITNGSCMKDEGLTCNCLTGIGINYIGYIIFFCLVEEDCNIHFQPSDSIGYIQVNYKEKLLIPITLDKIEISSYYLSEKICTKHAASGQQARIAFRQYSSREELKWQVMQAEQVMKDINKKTGVEYCYRFKFWIPFVAILRVYTLEESCKALLAMAIFMFPHKTLDFICQTIKMSEHDIAWLEQLNNFLIKYSDFLDGLKGYDGNFSFRSFCNKFKELTNVEVSYFIEDIIHNFGVPNSENTLYEIFSITYGFNLREKDKRGVLKKAIDILNHKMK